MDKKRFYITEQFNYVLLEESYFLLDNISGECYAFEGVGATVFKQIIDKRSIDEIIQKILQIYDINLDMAEKDIKVFLEELLNLKIIELC